jgi:hypothetical protein
MLMLMKCKCKCGSQTLGVLQVTDRHGKSNAQLMVGLLLLLDRSSLPLLLFASLGAMTFRVCGAATFSLTGRAIQLGR